MLICIHDYDVVSCLVKIHVGRYQIIFVQLQGTVQLHGIVQLGQGSEPIIKLKDFSCYAIPYYIMSPKRMKITIGSNETMAPLTTIEAVIGDTRSKRFQQQ
jgi:hypothetical protein